MPGTMGLGLGEFVAMWALMMTAMMLPSVWPFVAVYERTIRAHRVASPRRAGRRLPAGVGAGRRRRLRRGLGVRRTGRRSSRAGPRRWRWPPSRALGIYQLTPLKFRCLSHCRSPLAHLLHYTSFKGRLRDLRAGIEHGLYCLGCCWALMLVLLAFGVMNLPAMIGVAVIIAVEKVWRFGEAFARVVGVGALVYAVLVGVEPSLAPGPRSQRDHERRHGNGDDMEQPGPAGGDSPMYIEPPADG